MIFNFKFKDMPRPPAPSIRPLTTGCDFNHMVGIGSRTDVALRPLNSTDKGLASVTGASTS